MTVFQEDKELAKALRELRKEIDDYPLVRMTDVFMNQDNARRDLITERELRGVIDEYDPEHFKIVENIGNSQPSLAGRSLMRNTELKLPGTQTKSRANTIAYVRRDQNPRKMFFTQMSMTWPRTAKKATGRHEARAYMTYRSGLGIQDILAHQASRYVQGADEIQWEQIRSLAKRMAPWTTERWESMSPQRKAKEITRPRKLDWDANRRVGERGPGPDELAKMVGGKVYGGTRIDSRVARNIVNHSTRTDDTAGKWDFLGDHGHFIVHQYSISGYWTAKRKGKK